MARKKKQETPADTVESGVVTINERDSLWEIRKEGTLFRCYLGGKPQRILGTVSQIKAILSNYPMKTTIKAVDL
jgi:hypothetical protein